MTLSLSFNMHRPSHNPNRASSYEFANPLATANSTYANDDSNVRDDGDFFSEPLSRSGHAVLAGAYPSF